MPNTTNRTVFDLLTAILRQGNSPGTRGGLKNNLGLPESPNELDFSQNGRLTEIWQSRITRVLRSVFISLACV